MDPGAQPPPGSPPRRFRSTTYHPGSTYKASLWHDPFASAFAQPNMMDTFFPGAERHQSHPRANMPPSRSSQEYKFRKKRVYSTSAAAGGVLPPEIVEIKAKKSVALLFGGEPTPAEMDTLYQEQSENPNLRVHNVDMSKWGYGRGHFHLGSVPNFDLDDNSSNGSFSFPPTPALGGMPPSALTDLKMCADLHRLHVVDSSGFVLPPPASDEDFQTHFCRSE